VSDGVTVRGGSHGIDARCEDMEGVAHLFGRAARDTAGVSWSMQRYLIDPGTVGSALLDPAGAAEYEFGLARALDGPHGVSRLALECAAVATRLRAAATAYRLADRLDSTAHTLLDGILDLPQAAVDAEAMYLATGSPSRAVQRLLTADPGLADEGAALGIAVAGLVPSSVRRAATADGHPVVRATVDDDAAGGPPPRDLADVMTALAARNRGEPGEIDIRILSRPNGARAVIVDIPGTKSWDPLPTRDVTSVVTDIRAMSGHETSYERGVLEAMRRAGVRPDDDVMLVGHSEGGMVAIQAAIDASRAGSFRVTHVVTAGSPIGRTAGHVPSSISVLALENAHDLVPHLDAAANPASANVTTVTVDHDRADVLANHDIESAYVPGARDADASRNGSIRDFLRSAGAFFDASHVSTHRFVVSRTY
jgi:hypothetical protein